MNELEYGFWLVIIFMLWYEPVKGYADFKKFKEEVKTDSKARLAFYRSAIIGLWAPTVFVGLLVAGTELTLENIGLSFPRINTDTFGPFVTYFVFALVTVYFTGLLYYAIGYRFSAAIQTKLNQVKAKEWSKASFSEILPVTDAEKKRWNYVSLTAGITEEILYRGFLLFALPHLFPALSSWLVIGIASVLFGLAHTYQGFAIGVVRTAVVGLIFCVFYIGTSSIILLMVFHFLMDYVAKLGTIKQQSAGEAIK